MSQIVVVSGLKNAKARLAPARTHLKSLILINLPSNVSILYFDFKEKMGLQILR